MTCAPQPNDQISKSSPLFPAHNDSTFKYITMHRADICTGPQTTQLVTSKKLESSVHG